MSEEYRCGKEVSFWNKKEMVSYFAKKEEDSLIKERLLSVLQKDNKRALDLGCGGGRHTELLCRQNFNVFACDINEEMIAFTKERMLKLGYNKCAEQITVGNIIDLPFQNNFFDVVVTTGVLHQVKSFLDYKKAVINLSRVMKVGGIVCLNIFTNKFIDYELVSVLNEPWTYITQEGLWMTLLPKEYFYSLMDNVGLKLEEELSERTKKENTGLRTVLKANFVKT